MNVAIEVKDDVFDLHITDAGPEELTWLLSEEAGQILYAKLMAELED